MKSPTLLVAAVISILGAITACGGGGQATSGADAAKAHGPISIWYSNNAQEVAWGKQMVEAWNSAHATEQVSAQEIPAGQTSEAVISASITAGNTPCLIYNTSPAAVPNFQAQGGLMLFYNKTEFAKAGLSTTNPPLDSYSQFLDTAKKLVSTDAAKYAIYPSPSSQFFQPAATVTGWRCSTAAQRLRAG